MYSVVSSSRCAERGDDERDVARTPSMSAPMVLAWVGGGRWWLELDESKWWVVGGGGAGGLAGVMYL
jgi:hypothetical protein